MANQGRWGSKICSEFSLTIESMSRLVGATSALESVVIACIWLRACSLQFSISMTSLRLFVLPMTSKPPANASRLRSISLKSRQTTFLNCACVDSQSSLVLNSKLNVMSSMQRSQSWKRSWPLKIVSTPSSARNFQRLRHAWERLVGPFFFQQPAPRLTRRSPAPHSLRSQLQLAKRRQCRSKSLMIRVLLSSRRQDRSPE